MDWITDVNISAGNSKEGKIKLLSSREASISEEPSVVVPHAGICVAADTYFPEKTNL